MFGLFKKKDKELDKLQIRDISRVNLKPNDVIICIVERPLTIKYIEMIKKSLEGVFTDNKILVIDQAQIKVVGDPDA